MKSSFQQSCSTALDAFASPSRVYVHLWNSENFKIQFLSHCIIEFISCFVLSHSLTPSLQRMNNVVELLFEKGNLCFQKFFFSQLFLYKKKTGRKQNKTDFIIIRQSFATLFFLLKTCTTKSFPLDLLPMSLTLFFMYLFTRMWKVFICAPEETFLPNFFILDSS